MRTHRFDVLPIYDGTTIKEYFQADNWNDYSSISRKAVTHRDVIPLHTHIRDVIKGFASESRLFYFLTDEYRIAGLISVVNLNCRQVSVYLFSLLSELEVRLATFINEKIPEYDLFQMVFGAKTKEKHERVRAQYDEDKAKGLDLPVTEYVYMADLVNIIAKKKLFDTLGYKSRKQYEKSFNPLIDLRNKAAHPTRSVVTDAASTSQLWDRIDLIEEALFKLR
ncbi:MAG: hypothetical protein ACUZ8E_05495 [Candidatus Anammoxibacter sp.]